VPGPRLEQRRRSQKASYVVGTKRRERAR